MSVRIIEEPHVHLVGMSQVDEAGLRQFLEANDIASWSTDTEVGGERLIEVAGRCCYWSFARPRPGGNRAYIGHILEVGHGSVLEHAVFNLIITGVSRSFTHELVRHRAGFGFSQLSQRFVDETDAGPLEIVAPPLIEEMCREAFADGDIGRQRAAQGAIDDWRQSCDMASIAYASIAEAMESLLAAYRPALDATARRKAAREAARSVLPNATETKIFVTLNARAARHFIEMRADAGADAEMRRVAIAVLRVLRDAAPNLFGDYRVVDGAITTDHRKV